MAADLRKCCSEDDLPTAPWRFPLSFIPFLVPLYSFRKVRISPKVMIACNGFCLLHHTKAWLARDIISLIQWHDVFDFILLPFLVLLYSFRKVRISPKVMIACNGFCLLRHTKAWLARDIISLIQWYDVFACTLLHHEL